MTDKEKRKRQRKEKIEDFTELLFIFSPLIITLVVIIVGGIWITRTYSSYVERIEKEKQTRFNTCMKTYKDKYIENQGAFAMLQERKLSTSMEHQEISGSSSGALGLSSGSIDTKYINRLYQKNEFEKNNDWTNNCRKQRNIIKQVDFILKRSK